MKSDLCAQPQIALLNVFVICRLFFSGYCYWKFERKRGWEERCGDVTHGMLRIRRMLHAQRGILLREPDPPRHRFLGLALSFQRGAGDGQQLHQSFHLRRQALQGWFYHFTSSATVSLHSCNYVSI